MGLFSFFKSPKPEAISPTIDLVHLTIGDLKIGHEFSPSSSFIEDSEKPGTYSNEPSGIELGTKEGILDSIFIVLEPFTGRFLFDGKAMGLKAATTVTEIEQQLGEPYWTDRDDGEIILFYEFASGTLEIQFEFWENKGLACILITRNGVLSTEEQRKSYGVTMPWPPSS